jgi:hypothetical protein
MSNHDQRETTEQRSMGAALAQAAVGGTFAGASGVITSKVIDRFSRPSAAEPAHTGRTPERVQDGTSGHRAPPDSA